MWSQVALGIWFYSGALVLGTPSKELTALVSAAGRFSYKKLRAYPMKSTMDRNCADHKSAGSQHVGQQSDRRRVLPRPRRIEDLDVGVSPTALRTCRPEAHPQQSEAGLFALNLVKNRLTPSRRQPLPAPPQHDKSPLPSLANPTAPAVSREVPRFQNRQGTAVADQEAAIMAVLREQVGSAVDSNCPAVCQSISRLAPGTDPVVD